MRKEVADLLTLHTGEIRMQPHRGAECHAVVFDTGDEANRARLRAAYEAGAQNTIASERILDELAELWFDPSGNPGYMLV